MGLAFARMLEQQPAMKGISCPRRRGGFVLVIFCRSVTVASSCFDMCVCSFRVLWNLRLQIALYGCVIVYLRYEAGVNYHDKGTCMLTVKIPDEGLAVEICCDSSP